MELYDSLSVLDNVALGPEAGMAGAGVRSHLVRRAATTVEGRRKRHRGPYPCGIETLADRQVGPVLPTGQRRLVELARCVASPFGFLLLDEPSSGLDRTETRHFGEILGQIVVGAGHGDPARRARHGPRHGRLREDLRHGFRDLMYFSGSPEEVRTSESVRGAYLGTESAYVGRGTAGRMIR